MPRRTDTRACFLRTAADLMRRQGYHATGLNQILTESGAPKGSLYFHFPGGKEQLAAEAVTLSGRQMGEQISLLLDSVDDPGEGCRRIAAAFTYLLTESDFRDGCPVATVALDTAGESEPIRTACAQTYREWSDLIADALLRWGVRGAQVESLAAFALSSIEGALLLARTQRDTAVLDIAASQLESLIRNTISQE